jgi:sodium-dependent dicarboxylate transporter 2/3/5
MSESMERPYTLHNRIGLLLGPILFVVMLLVPRPEGMSPEAQRAAAVALLMASWWICEAIPIYATALMPLALFPLLGVLNYKGAARPYGDHIVFLMMGGFFIAQAMQKWNLHRRIALHTIRLIGKSPRRMILGFMVATAFLSMWISNSATTVMMLPIAVSVIMHLESSTRLSKAFSTALVLSIAYGASAGGMGTLIGTPPNAVFAGQVQKLFPQAPAVTFNQWLLIGIPITCIFLPVMWLLITRVLFRIKEKRFEVDHDVILEELENLGKMSKGEKSVLVVFSITVFLWMSRPLWSRLLPEPDMIGDATIAILMSIVLFALPVDLSNREFALDWQWARGIPWGVLVLLGGGYSLAHGVQESGLALWIGNQLAFLGGVPPVFMVIIVCLLLTFLTEITMNTSTTNLMMPVMASTALAIHVHPFLLMLPATLSASCAFMLPAATPPNAIIFGSGKITIPQMARAGIVMNFIGVILITVLVFFIVLPIFGIDPTAMPGWAH